ncbi:MAG: hypothetical protein J7494_00985 [Sphingobium sp.]|nr:hypothetical protein [Sphingobium sp.]
MLLDQHTIWVLIPIAAIFAGVFKYNLRLKEKQIDRAHAHESEMAQRHAAETRQLEERVQVLERIVTDKGMNVSLEIEKLRDQPTVRDMRAD